MQRVFFHVLAAVSMSILSLVVFSVAGLADANPNNRGHHYGQLKHQHVAPPPAPAPNPQTNPGPSGGSTSTNTTAGVAPSTPSAISLTLPIFNLLPAAAGAGQLKRVKPPVPYDPWWWLVLLLPPTLLALWVIAARRLALSVAPVAKPQPAPSPA